MNRVYRSVKQILLTGGKRLMCALALGEAAAAPISSGAIYTTNTSGTVVNGDIYEAKA